MTDMQFFAALGEKLGLVATKGNNWVTLFRTNEDQFLSTSGLSICRQTLNGGSAIVSGQYSVWDGRVDNPSNWLSNGSVALAIVEYSQG